MDSASPKKIIIRLISDTHHEFRNTMVQVKPFSSEIAKTHITVCIMAGDIGHPDEKIYSLFLRLAKKNFDYVLVVAGNHEYYNKSTRVSRKTQEINNILLALDAKENGLDIETQGDQGYQEDQETEETEETYLPSKLFERSSIKEVDQLIEKICHKEGCIYLNRKIVQLGNIFFIGCTLWSEIPEDSKPAVMARLNDMRYIDYGGSTLTVDDYNKLHQQDLKFISDSLNKISKMDNKAKVVVITHHAPSIKMNNEKYLSDPLSKAYATDLEYLMEDPISIWINGHTHLVRETKINDVRLISNCYGYDSEKNGYNPDFQIEYP